MPPFLVEVLTAQEIAELGLASSPEGFEASKRLPWRAFKAARSWLVAWFVLELLIEWCFIKSSLLRWQLVPILTGMTVPLRTLCMAMVLSVTLCVCEACVTHRSIPRYKFGFWEAECLITTGLTFLARLLDLSFCVSLYVEGDRPVLTMVASLLILCVSSIPRFWIGAQVIDLLFSSSKLTPLRVWSWDCSRSSSPCLSLKPLLTLTKLMRRPLTEDLPKTSLCLETHPASLQISWLSFWAHVLEFAHKVKRTRTQCSPQWQPRPGWDAPELLLSVSDVSAGAVELADRTASLNPVQESALDSTQILATKIRRGLQHLDSAYAASDHKILQLVNAAYLFDHYLLGHLLSDSYLARDLIEELSFSTSLGMFVWCHLTVLILNLIKFHTLMSAADDKISSLPLFSLMASLIAACNVFFVHTFDQQLMADLMDDD